MRFNHYIPKHRYHYRPPAANHPQLLRAVRLKVQPPIEDVYDLRKFMLAVRDQGPQGCCSGHATAAFREAIRSISLGTTLQTPSLAVAYLYARTRMVEGTFPQDAGATIIDEMNTLNNYGVCRESDMPYDPSNAGEQPTPADDVAAQPFRAGLPVAVEVTDPSFFESVLAGEQPIVIGMPVYQSFETTDGSGMIPVPDTANEQLLGGHALLVVGYDRTKKVVTLRNSWGKSFGDGGYGYLPYALISSFFEAWTAPLAP